MNSLKSKTEKRWREERKRKGREGEEEREGGGEPRCLYSGQFSSINTKHGPDSVLWMVCSEPSVRFLQHRNGILNSVRK